MNDAQRRELEQIRVEQQLLQAGLARLERRLSAFEAADSAVEATPAVVTPAVPPPPVPASILAPVPPVVSVPPLEPTPGVPPPLPPWLISPAEPENVPVPPLPRPQPVPARESLEMRIGTTWFVRVGIVLLVTSLAFLGNFLYHNIVPHLGPAAKVAALYVVAGVVTGVGAWLERSRQARESARVKQYAQIVFAGGLAAVYYVTYVAHYYERLRVIPNALLAGALLLGWAAFMIWLAERRASETLATVAILLGFYASAINEGVAGFTLASNFFLAAGAAFLLRRHLWRVFPFASVLATYGSYAFWNYFHSYLGWRGLDTPPVHGGTRFWTECAFLFVYWLLFTWAVFTARDEALPPVRRAAFASLNNSAFFLLTTWLILGERGSDFWKWSLGYGVVLLGLSEAARRLPKRLDAKTESSYQLQGILLVTLGFVTYFSGWQLSLVLAVQSVVLLTTAGLRRSRLQLTAACASAVLAFAWAAGRLAWPGGAVAWASGLGVGGFLVLGAWLGERLLEKEKELSEVTTGSGFGRWLIQVPAYFSMLGLAVWLWVMHRQVTDDRWAVPLLALAAVVLTASVYVLRIRAIPVFAQAFAVAAYVRWFSAYGWFSAAASPPWWNPLSLLAATLALGRWWLTPEARKRVADWPWEHVFSSSAAVAAVLLLQGWLQPLARNDDQWIGEAAALSLVILGCAVVSRYDWLALASQWLLVVSALLFVEHWNLYPGGGYDARMWLKLGPWAGALLTILIAGRLIRAQPRVPSKAALTASIVYEAAATGLFLAWAAEYFPHTVLFPIYCLVGAGIFALGLLRSEPYRLWLSVVPTAAGLSVFGLASLFNGKHGLIDLLGVACLGAQQWWGRRQSRQNGSLFPRPAQNALITAATLCTWILVTRWMAPWRGGAFTLAAAWSGFAAAVFAVGLLLRERLYRWLGLLVLAVTLLRVILVDIWQLGSLERAISAFVLSVTLLGLGYLYNRYHDKWQNLL